MVGGHRLSYRLLVENVGTAKATGVTVRDELPAGVTYESDSAGCARSGATLTCAAPDLAPGASTTIDVAVLADPIAGAGPAPDPQAYHELTPYKTEAQVDLEPGETRTVTLGCAGAGIVSDGSVRVDHVDQGTGSLTDVQVLSAASTGLGTWKAVVRNHATGRAQAKAFAVCLPGATEVADRQTGHADGHAHTLSADADQVVSSRAWNVGRHSTTLACPIGSTPIAPGYSLSGGSARLVGSEPTSSGAWELTFGVDEPTTATVSVRCLRTTTSAEQGHTHDLRFTHVVRTVSVPADQNVEEQVICPDDAKGVVATWETCRQGLVPLGNDPRLKTRAFRLLNTTGSSLTGTVDLVCLNDRTAVESMGHDDPVVVANTATVASTSVDADPGNNSSTATVTVLPGTATAALLRGPTCAVATSR